MRAVYVSVQWVVISVQCVVSAAFCVCLELSFVVRCSVGFGCVEWFMGVGLWFRCSVLFLLGSERRLVFGELWFVVRGLWF